MNTTATAAANEIPAAKFVFDNYTYGSAEASELSWKPGQFPETFTIPDYNRDGTHAIKMYQEKVLYSPTDCGAEREIVGVRYWGRLTPTAYVYTPLRIDVFND